MNKRIKELILEANIYVAKNAERGSTKEILDDLKDGKFAELIVRECDKYVESQYDEFEPWMRPGELLKHFGVK